MADRVFLHVGVPKSGTTYLQTTMWHNRPALRAQGVLYPGRRRMDHFHACQDLRGKRGPRPGGAWDRLRDELSDWPGTGLVTHEFFAMATAEQAQRAVARPGARGGPRGPDRARLRPPVPRRVAGGAEDELDPLPRRVHDGGAGGAAGGRLELAAART